MNDSINTLIDKIVSFRDARNWKQFHNPKDLAISISLEASELLEVFQWSGSDVSASSCYDIYNRLMGYYVIDEDDVDKFSDILFATTDEPGKKNKIYNLLKKAANNIKLTANFDSQRPQVIKKDISSFIRCYEFISQVTCLDDKELHKLYLFLTYLKGMLNDDQPGPGFNLDGKLKADNFMQKKKETHTKNNITSDPSVKISNADRLRLTPTKKERLSRIIDEINSKTGNSFDKDIVYSTIIQIKDLMKKNDKLRRSAQSNELQDFALSFNDEIDQTLVSGLSQNSEFFSFLLNNDEIKHELLDIFIPDVYDDFRYEGSLAAENRP